MLALTIAATVHISVLGSFHPVQFELKPAKGQILVVESAGRSEIVQARIRLADEGLTYNQRAELWRIVDYRELCLQMLVRDFPAELERIDREIEHELRR